MIPILSCANVSEMGPVGTSRAGHVHAQTANQCWFIIALFLLIYLLFYVCNVNDDNNNTNFMKDNVSVTKPDPGHTVLSSHRRTA